MFKVDQQVMYKHMTMPATILSGPHPTHGRDRWLIRKADGKVSLVPQTDLAEITERRDLAAKAIYDSLGGSYGYTWRTVSIATKRRYLLAADAVLKALDSKPPLAVGDRIRILKRNAQYATVSVGEVFTVNGVNTERVSVKRRDSTGSWSFRMNTEGVDWERVA
ncbi:hypothetical protein PV343_01350 [Streptomyces sp. WI03-4A]|uniref:hypothetical protein n=1 Tax=Streptomyces sp. WI03-4A TaxID=3028706 RepID=UPI0029A490F2|nr:hypothetical protein [Streptomyces sp. WI03-4A]MDX2590970.1 hypothetical protein [Streptomyces sp. WI03-4A]